MIDVTVYQNTAGTAVGLRMKGHAEYAAYGQDIVCAAVSALVINTINAVESFTDDTFEQAIHQEEDVVSFMLTSDPVSASSELLLKALILGLSGIQSEYGKKHVKLHFKRKQEV